VLFKQNNYFFISLLLLLKATQYPLINKWVDRDDFLIGINLNFGCTCIRRKLLVVNIIWMEIANLETSAVFTMSKGVK